MSKLYTVTCQKCKGESTVEFEQSPFNKYILWREVGRVISARPRLDGYWGFECLCGNNSLMSDQENRIIDDKANPSPRDLQKVIADLQFPYVKEVDGGTIVDNFALIHK